MEEIIKSNKVFGPSFDESKLIWIVSISLENDITNATVKVTLKSISDKIYDDEPLDIIFNVSEKDLKDELRNVKVEVQNGKIEWHKLHIR